MKKYKLYNGDCIEVIKDIKDKSIDLIVTDPPYKITQRGNHGNSGGMFKEKDSYKGDLFKHNNIDIENYIKDFYRILKDDAHMYIMCNNTNLIHFLNVATNNGFKFVKSLIWDKGNKIMGQYYMGQYEYILFFRKKDGKAKKINNCGTSDILSVPNKKNKDENGKNLHNTQKPVALMETLVENSSNEGEIVLDCFMGIGSTGIACMNTNRRFIGIELDDKYFEIAENRIKEDI